MLFVRRFAPRHRFAFPDLARTTARDRTKFYTRAATITKITRARMYTVEIKKTKILRFVPCLP